MQPSSFWVSSVLALAATLPGYAAPPDDTAAQLDGPKYTCIGAERAGSAAGVAAYTGRFLGAWPGLGNVQGYAPGPYAAEKPLFVITAQNMAQYAAQLGEGQQALLRKYPQSFRLPVYPSHRDFRYADRVCQIVQRNLHDARLRDDGLAITQLLGGIPFPFPRNGLEAIYNLERGAAEWSDAVVYDIADVYANGSIAWGRTRLKVLVPANDPKLAAPMNSAQQSIAAYFYHEQILPERDRGVISVGNTNLDFRDGQINAWVYNPGLRRAKQAMEVGSDYAVPPAGLHTVDDESLFNGTPQHFSWKLLGKREIYVPYDNFRINDPALKYADLVKPNTLNPDYQRYELHRVWVVEGTLRPGERHVYSKRLLYIDEDSWQALWSDTYDMRGQLWRSSYADYFYSPQSQAFERGVIVYHDLSNGTYDAEYLVNESKEWWRFNDPSFTPMMFGPSALAHGH
jgi:hypothetical protein